MADIIHVRGRRGSAEGAGGEGGGAERGGAWRRSGGASPLRRRPGRVRGRGGGKGAAGARARRLLRGAQGTVRPAPLRASPHPAGLVSSHTPTPPGAAPPGPPRRRRAAAEGTEPEPPTPMAAGAGLR